MKTKRIVGAFGTMMLWGISAQANAQALMPGVKNSDLLLWVLLTAVVILFTLFMAVSLMLYAFVQKNLEQTEAEVSSTWLRDFWNSFNAALPTSRNQEILLDHNYDGIMELDNQLPPWWKWMFYASIVFAFVYMYHYHFGDDPTPVSIRELKADVAEANIAKAEYLAKMANLIDESNATELTDASSLGNGKTVYTKNCKVCHGAAGEGGVGPNLTDTYWIHGGDIKDLFKTVKYGVPQNGMLPWQDKLRPKEIQDVVSYILTMQGTNPPNGKAAQGDLYEKKVAQ